MTMSEYEYMFGAATMRRIKVVDMHRILSTIVHLCSPCTQLELYTSRHQRCSLDACQRFQVPYQSATPRNMMKM